MNRFLTEQEKKQKNLANKHHDRNDTTGLYESGARPKHIVVQEDFINSEGAPEPATIIGEGTFLERQAKQDLLLKQRQIDVESQNDMHDRAVSNTPQTNPDIPSINYIQQNQNNPQQPNPQSNMQNNVNAGINPTPSSEPDKSLLDTMEDTVKTVETVNSIFKIPKLFKTTLTK